MIDTKELEELIRLKNKGIITEEQFNKKKASILNASQTKIFDSTNPLFKKIKKYAIIIFIISIVFTGIWKAIAMYEYHKNNSIHTSYYKNGRIESSIPYKDGKINGVAKWYFDNGRLKKVVSYTNGIANGSAKLYYDTGKIKRESQYYNGEEHGIVKIYNEDGKIEKEAEYKNGYEGRLINGMERIEYPDGGYCDTEYKNGKQNGIFKSYDKQGRITMDGILDNGFSGIVKEYYEDGSLKAEYERKNNKLDGYFKFYHENGNIFREYSYKEGKANGKFKEYYEDGSISVDAIVKNNEGKGTKYHKNGRKEKFFFDVPTPFRKRKN